MSGAQKLTIVRRQAVPLGHLWLEMLVSDCGAVTWRLLPPDMKADAPAPADQPVIASGFVDDEFRRDVCGACEAIDKLFSEVCA
ncbi:hypothetical protein ACX9MO_15350 [Pseudooceanicola sp. 502str34]